MLFGLEFLRSGEVCWSNGVCGVALFTAVGAFHVAQCSAVSSPSQLATPSSARWYGLCDFCCVDRQRSLPIRAIHESSIVGKSFVSMLLARPCSAPGPPQSRLQRHQPRALHPGDDGAHAPSAIPIPCLQQAVRSFHVATAVLTVSHTQPPAPRRASCVCCLQLGSRLPAARRVSPCHPPEHGGGRPSGPEVGGGLTKLLRWRSRGQRRHTPAKTPNHCTSPEKGGMAADGGRGRLRSTLR